MNGPQEQLAAYREAVVKNPASAAAHYELGNALLSAGQSQEAAASLESAVALQPGHADAQYRLAYAYSLLGRLDDARGCCLKALAIQPDHAQVYFHLGKIYAHQNQFRQAAECYRQAVVLRPDFARVHSELGGIWVKLGNPEEALACFRAALELVPDETETLYQFGVTSIGLGHLEEALSALRRAIALRPDYVEAHNAIGNALIYLGRPAEAIPHYHQALALNMEPGLVYSNLGIAHHHLGQTDEAIKFYSKALTTNADNAELHQNLGTILSKQGRMDEALRSFEQALALRPDYIPAYDSALLCLLYSDGASRTSPPLSARDYARRYERQLRDSWPVHANSRDPERRLKVGYVSPDFWLHSVAYFVEPLLAHHDRGEVEVYGYYNNRRKDAVTVRLRAAVDHWLPCEGMTDEALAARIQADGIDILVDLAGHTGGNRLGVFARKPAPVQVTYLGYPATTGLSAMDYRLVTADTDPPGAERWHSERLYRLPRSLWCYRPPATMPAVIPATPARRNGYITFGALNNVAKVSDATVATWAHLLRAVPGAQLVMTKLADSAQRLMHEHFATQGIAAERLILHGKLPAADYYALLNTIDIALDPFPYTGTTTTCESLWMGVPVVTLIGETSVARSGYALLKSIGLEALAAHDENEYITIAAALAQDLDRLDALRGGMRARIESSPLRDEAGLTRDLEAAYRTVWREWCEGSTPSAESAAILHERGIKALQAGRFAEALDLLVRVQRVAFADPRLQNDLGFTYHALGHYDEAVVCYQRAIALKPDYFEAHANLATTYSSQGALDEAGSSLERAIALRPDIAELHYNLGNYYGDRKRPEEAIACYRRALTLNPRHTDSHYNLGVVLMEAEQFDEAARFFRAAVRMNPGYVEAHYNLGCALMNLRNYDEAIACFDAVLTLRPDDTEALPKRGHCLLLLGRGDEALAHFERYLALQPGELLAYHSLLFALNYLPSTRPATVLTASRRYAEQFESPLRAAWPAHTNRRDPERRLKIGYVSADFRLHSVAYFMEPLLARHDRDAVEVYGYYNNTREDAVTARLRGVVDHWVPCKGMTDEELAARLQADGIDILVDLAGHTRGNRLLVFARKPAPVQVTYLGYPATTGLSAMDYRLVTADTDPPGAERWHSERLYRLPRSLWCYRPAAEMPAVIPTTPARGVGRITFGAMNNIAKLSVATLATWTVLLTRLPASRLVLTNLPEGEARDVLRRRFAAQGIAPERVTLHGKLPAVAYYALLNTIDIALDPFPYTGTTTTCESLWMGVPVVTLIGETSVARSGYALLKSIGLEELAAHDENEYITIATALAQDLDRLDALRGGMRARIAASPLRDEAGLTRDIEAAYRAMWKEWCRPKTADRHSEHGRGDGLEAERNPR